LLSMPAATQPRPAAGCSASGAQAAVWRQTHPQGQRLSPHRKAQAGARPQPLQGAQVYIRDPEHVLPVVQRQLSQRGQTAQLQDAPPGSCQTGRSLPARSPMSCSCGINVRHTPGPAMIANCVCPMLPAPGAWSGCVRARSMPVTAQSAAQARTAPLQPCRLSGICKRRMFGKRYARLRRSSVSSAATPYAESSNCTS
jgi:hypothetical protein